MPGPPPHRGLTGEIGPTPAARARQEQVPKRRTSAYEFCREETARNQPWRHRPCRKRSPTLRWSRATCRRSEIEIASATMKNDKPKSPGFQRSLHEIGSRQPGYFVRNRSVLRMNRIPLQHSSRQFERFTRCDALGDVPVFGTNSQVVLQNSSEVFGLHSSQDRLINRPSFSDVSLRSKKSLSGVRILYLCPARKSADIYKTGLGCVRTRDKSRLVRCGNSVGQITPRLFGGRDAGR